MMKPYLTSEIVLLFGKSPSFSRYLIMEMSSTLPLEKP